MYKQAILVFRVNVFNILLTESVQRIRRKCNV